MPFKATSSSCVPTSTTRPASITTILSALSTVASRWAMTSVVRSLIDHVTARARELDLRVGALEASTLIELTAFGTAVAMQYRESRRERKRAVATS